MSFTRKNLREMLAEFDITLTADAMTALCELHTATLAEKVEAQVKEALDGVVPNNEPDTALLEEKQAELDAIKKEFEAFKETTEASKTSQLLREAKVLKLKEAKFPESVLDLILKDELLDTVQMNDAKEVVGLEEAIEKVVAKHESLIVVEQGSTSVGVTGKPNNGESQEVDVFLQGFE